MVNCTNKTFLAVLITAFITMGSFLTINSQIKQGSKILYIIERKHVFSSDKSEDLFQIILQGKDTLSGVINFQILTQNRKVIYKEEFSGIDLIGYGLPEDELQKSTHKDSCSYIIERMNKFFSEDNFLTPAIQKGETYDSEYSDKKLWNEIASDSTAIGFYYLTGEENNRQIAFSKKSAKVVVYKSYD